MAVDVEPRTEQDIDLVRRGLLAERPPDFVQKVVVERLGEKRARRKACRRPRRAYAVRPVGRLCIRHAERRKVRDASRSPRHGGRLRGTQLDLLLQGQTPDDRFGLCVYFVRHVRGQFRKRAVRSHRQRLALARSKHLRLRVGRKLSVFEIENAVAARTRTDVPDIDQNLPSIGGKSRGRLSERRVGKPVPERIDNPVARLLVEVAITDFHPLAVGQFVLVRTEVAV